MLTIWRTVYRARRSLTPVHSQSRHIADQRPFAVGDLVLLRQKFDRSASPILTKPLKAGGRIDGHRGVIQHDEIIGKRVRDVVKSATLRSGKEGTEYRLHEVKLEEYVRLSRRLVTPIYPADASLIVELLDLHVDALGRDAAKEDAPKLEILEAGTGHGALTLYLSRAIDGANPPRPDFNDEQDDAARNAAIDAWKRTRRAVIHTIDSSAKYSQHAEKVVKGFKHGMYYDNVDFHVTDVSAWTRKALDERQNIPFLSHAFLDLPNVELHLDTVAKALRTDGCLMVFTPSITQIVDCLRKIREAGFPLELDNVIELGVNGGSGGREWNVKAVKTRSGKVEVARETLDEAQGAEDEGGPTLEQDTDEDSESSFTREQPRARDENWSMICRPKVGERIIGGGFLGLWRKQRDMRQGV